MAEHPREQRHFPRVPSKNAVLVRRVDDDTSEALAKTQSVGLGGCMFTYDGPLGVGAAVELLISLPGRVVTARGRVAWENATPSGQVDVGVQFIELAAADRAVLDTVLAAAPAEP